MVLFVPKDIRLTVWDFVSKNNIGQRSKANGNKEQQYVGLLGEVMIKKHLGLDYSLSYGFDGGFDLNYKGLNIDVKTMGRMVNPRPYYVNNFIAYQNKFNCDAYIFCSLNKTDYNLTICGWVTKPQLQERSIIYEEGTIRTRSDGSTFKLKAPTYEIENNKLNQMSKL